jgi:hypothetical protein
LREERKRGSVGQANKTPSGGIDDSGHFSRGTNSGGWSTRKRSPTRDKSTYVLGGVAEGAVEDDREDEREEDVPAERSEACRIRRNLVRRTSDTVLGTRRFFALSEVKRSQLSAQIKAKTIG